VSAAVAASLPGRFADRMRVIPHGVDPDAIAAARHRVHPDHDHRSPDLAVRAVAVASHRDSKNYPNLLRAVRRARDAGAPLQLLAVGDGPDLNRHRALAKELGLEDAVQFEPPSLDVLAVIASADLLVVASDFEGAPLVVQEALALGLPVVATAVGRVPELVSSLVGRVVAPRDPVALGAALAELAGDAELRARMGEAAAHDRHAWTLDDVIDAHLDLYGEIQAR
jgi:glycosyltransferase involved in cell wall biosynthesis